MALIEIGVARDCYNRPCLTYRDTDDLSDEDYNLYHKLKDLANSHESVKVRNTARVYVFHLLDKGISDKLMKNFVKDNL